MTTDERYQELLAALRAAGLRRTPQRLAVLRLLAAGRAHPTAADVYQRLLPRFPSLSQTTVYNTLQALARHGLITELGVAGDAATHYDTETEPHLNLICNACGRIVDLGAPVPSLAAVSAESGYDIRGARLVYYGLCPACRRKNR
jgi:Fur family peroxide stress response transcriptional regulator